IDATGGAHRSRWAPPVSRGWPGSTRGGREHLAGPGRVRRPGDVADTRTHTWWGYRVGMADTTATPAPTTRTRYWYADNKQALLSRLRRIEGQVRGVYRMVDEDA